MNLDKIDILLRRYQQRETSVEENRLVETWLAENDGGGQRWNKMDDESQKQFLSELYTDIASITQLQGGTTSKPAHRNDDFRLWRSVSSIAALFVVACGLYLAWPGLQRWITPVSYQVRTTTVKPELVILDDGTKVWLNSGSSLKYPDQFKGPNREVHLQGEAYFEVAHNASAPFLVHTGNLTTKVLGTIFNVRAYADDAEVRIILSSGKVEVIKNEQNTERKGLTLLPSQMVTYHKSAGSLLKSRVSNAYEYSAWKEGKLIFDETPVSEVFNRLGHIYGVKFSFTDKEIKECAITGSFNINQKLEEILQSISLSVDGEFIRRANQITFSGQGCN